MRGLVVITGKKGATPNQRCRRDSGATDHLGSSFSRFFPNQRGTAPKSLHGEVRFAEDVLVDDCRREQRQPGRLRGLNINGSFRYKNVVPFRATCILKGYSIYLD